MCLGGVGSGGPGLQEAVHSQGGQLGLAPSSWVPTVGGGREAVHRTSLSLPDAPRTSNEVGPGKGLWGGSPCIIVSQGCPNNIPHPRGFERQTFTVPESWRPEVPNPGVRRTRLPPEALEEGPSLPSHLLAAAEICGGFGLCAPHFSLRPCLHTIFSISSSYKDTCSWI